MAQLGHPNIVRILVVIEDGSDLALVMEYAPGGSLSTRLTAGGLAPRHVVEVLAPVADALGVAHRRGVIHRDVKPSNILFAADGRPLLADFGIALASGQTSLTGTGTALGTAAYLAPELVRADEPTVASDVYALAVVAYQALVGQLPYHAANPLAVVVAADAGVHPRLDPAVVGSIGEVVERAMARNTEERYESMVAFAAAMRAATTLEPPDGMARVRPIENASDQTSFFGPIGSPTPHDVLAPRAALVSAAMSPASSQRRRRLVALGAALVTAIAIGVFAIARQPNGSASFAAAQVYRPPACNPATTVQCVTGITRTASGLRVAFAGTDPVTYEFGRIDDVPLVANWFCGPHETLAVYRPTTGVVYYFDGWPDPDQSPPVAYADSTGRRDARPSVGLRNDDSCADVRLVAPDGSVTWFEPAVQPGRLAVVRP